MNRFVLSLTFFFVVLPTTVASLVGALFGVGWMLDSIGSSDDSMRERHLGGTFFVLVLLVAGWFGVVTLWRVFVGLIRGTPPSHPRLVWAGLLAGCVASICLIFIVKSGAISLFFGWPLVAVLHLGHEFSKTHPLKFKDSKIGDGL